MGTWSRQQLEDLYIRHGPAVLRRANTILGNSADAEDVLQDVFATVMAKIDRFRGDSAVGTWLYQITTRACLDRIKVRKRRDQLLEVRNQQSPAQTGDSTEIASLLRDALEKLPRHLASIAVYYYLDGMTHEEIADLLGCSRRKVGYLLDRFHSRASRLITLPEGTTGGA